MLMESPDDTILHMSLIQADEQKQYLLKEIKEAQIKEKRHVLEWHWQSENMNLDLETFTSQLISVEKVVNDTSKHVTKTSIHRKLWVGQIVSGSVGIYISTSPDEGLLPSEYNTMGRILNFVFSVLEKLKQHDDVYIKSHLAEIFESNLTLIDSYKKLFSNIHMNKRAVKLKWNDYDGGKIEIGIDVDNAKHITEILEGSPVKIENTVEENIKIKGISLIKESIEFYLVAGPQLKKNVRTAKFDPKFAVELAEHFNQDILAVFIVTRSINDVTNKEEEKWHLVEIK